MEIEGDQLDAAIRRLQAARQAACQQVAQMLDCPSIPESLNELFSEEPDGNDGFVAATKLLVGAGRFSSYREFKRFLDNTPTIRTRHPQKYRLEVHAGDWVNYWAEQETASSEALDLAADVIASVERAKSGKTKGRK